jgi:hypothetical protein
MLIDYEKYCDFGYSITVLALQRKDQAAETSLSSLFQRIS